MSSAVAVKAELAADDNTCATVVEPCVDAQPFLESAPFTPKMASQLPSPVASPPFEETAHDPSASPSPSPSPPSMPSAKATSAEPSSAVVSHVTAAALDLENSMSPTDEGDQLNAQMLKAISDIKAISDRGSVQSLADEKLTDRIEFCKEALSTGVKVQSWPLARIPSSLRMTQLSNSSSFYDSLASLDFLLIDARTITKRYMIVHAPCPTHFLSSDIDTRSPSPAREAGGLRPADVPTLGNSTPSISGKLGGQLVIASCR